jgi:TDG/mug DNA glycosylase family protein
VLPDYLAPGVKAVFVGTAAGEASAARGHYYSGRGNRFWELLWVAGLTEDRILIPERDGRVLDYGIGLTDVVKGRAASTDNKLRSSDYDVAGFVQKIERFRPAAVAFNGKGAAKVVARHLGRAAPDHGPAEFMVGPAMVYVLPSSSSSNNDPRRWPPKATKDEWWAEFGHWLDSLQAGKPPTRI